MPCLEVRRERRSCAAGSVPRSSPRVGKTRSSSATRRFDGNLSTLTTASIAASEGLRRDAPPERRGVSRVASDVTRPAPKRSPRAAGLARAPRCIDGLHRQKTLAEKKNILRSNHGRFLAMPIEVNRFSAKISDSSATGAGGSSASETLFFELQIKGACHSAARV